MSVSPCLAIHSVTVATISQNTLTISIEIATSEVNKTVKTSALVDSGAGGKFINQNFAQKFKIHKLDQPLKVYNVDGTENKQGTIKNYVNLKFTIGNKNFNKRLLVTGLGKQKIILRFPWLTEQNPTIDWKTRKFEWKEGLRRYIKFKRASPADAIMNDEKGSNHFTKETDD